MNTRSFSLGLLITGLAAACVLAPSHAAVQTASTASLATASLAYAPADPARQVEDLARLFRAGDVAGLAQALVPPSKWEEFRLAYQLKQLQPTPAEERDRFAEKLQRFTAPDAVDTLMAEIEPKLETARPQAAGALMMGIGAMQMALSAPDSKLTEDQRAALQKALPGVQAWATSTDFLNAETLRQALTLLTSAARQTGISNLDQLKAMPLETALSRAGALLVALKQSVRLYGIDLDAIADSLQVDVVAMDGDSARVRTTITVFDAPIWAEHDLVLLEGRWYGKHASARWDHDDADPEADLEHVDQIETSRHASPSRS